MAWITLICESALSATCQILVGMGLVFDLELVSRRVFKELFYLDPNM